MKEGTLLHRQVNPSWVQNGRVTSQAFRPTPKDDFRLSVYDGDQIDAEASWIHFTQELGLRSIGVYSVTCHECEILELNVLPDPDTFKEHVLIDFEGLSKTQIKSKAQALKIRAEERGWLYQADEAG